MINSLSPGAQVILMLTAPLIVGRSVAISPELLSPGEFRRLALVLRHNHHQLADLLTGDAIKLLEECGSPINIDRLNRLLDRGFLLSQAFDRWQTRGIWVVSRVDAAYPRRLAERLKGDAPPVLYGCGDADILNSGGLAVVGSRHVDDALIEYTEKIGRLAAEAQQTIVSGGARGIDQAAMRGALESLGKVIGVLPDSLERAAVHREHRQSLMEARLTFVSPYDPYCGFNVGRAMQRNKLIYALAEAALIVSSDFEKGGTWTGAVEQLDKLHLVPLYVRSNGELGKGLEAIWRKGAAPWPDPAKSSELLELLRVGAYQNGLGTDQEERAVSATKESTSDYEVGSETTIIENTASGLSPQTSAGLYEDLLEQVRALMGRTIVPLADTQVAAELNVPRQKARACLHRLVTEGEIEKLPKPVRYRISPPQGAHASLFELKG